MEYTVTDPSTGMPLQFEAKPEKFNGEQGYRILCKNGSHFFIANKFGTWRLADHHHIDLDLLARIGLAIEEQQMPLQG